MMTNLPLIGCRVFGLVLVSLPGVALAAPVTIQPLEPHHAVFANSEVRFAYRVAAGEAALQGVRWRVTTTGRVIARGEAEVVRVNGKPIGIELAFRTPPVRNGLTLACEVRVEAGPDSEYSEPFWVYPPDAFAGRRAAWKADQLIVLDPEGDTADRLSEEKILHTLTRRIPPPDVANNKVLLIGEAVEFERHPSLRRRLSEFARGGGQVLCLAPASGGFSLADAEDTVPAVHLLSHDAVEKRHKRLNIRAFSYEPKPGLPAVQRLSLAARRDSLWIEVHEKTPAWPMCQIVYPRQDNRSQGRIVVCGYPLVQAWEADPTPRYLLAALITSLLASQDRDNQLLF